MRKKYRSLLEEDSFEEPLINLTPLIDVVFVVLITFMLIAPVLDIDSVDLAAGSSAKKENPDYQASPLSIAIQADNSIRYKNQLISLPELSKILREEKKRSGGIIPQLIPDKQAPFGTYQAVKNALEEAGFEQMDVVLKPN